MAAKRIEQVEASMDRYLLALEENWPSAIPVRFTSISRRRLKFNDANLLHDESWVYPTSP
jgi:hypothetical protein